MIHPSYVDLMKVVNKNVEEGETPVINSRYSIVMATAKRARQIVDGDEPLVKVSRGEKPLSIAVDELNQEEIRILAEDEIEEEYFEITGEGVSEEENPDPLQGESADYDGDGTNGDEFGQSAPVDEEEEDSPAESGEEAADEEVTSGDLETEAAEEEPEDEEIEEYIEEEIFEETSDAGEEEPESADPGPAADVPVDEEPAE